MVKVKTISRTYEDTARERPTDILKIHKNVDPSQHPHEKAREYTRALNAVKLERIFAKPFVNSLSGHRDGIFSMARHPTSLSTMISGACDGEIRVWNLAFGTCLWDVNAHSGFVRGMSVLAEGSHLLSAGDDKKVHLWKLDCLSKDVITKNTGNSASKEEEDDDDSKEPLATWLGEHSFTSLDSKRLSSTFATSSATQIDIWDLERSTPVNTLQWGNDSVVSLRFNPVETDVLASSATDRSISLYDLRGNSPIRKVYLEMKSNSISWNPMEAFHFTVANEDHNLYTFDMRKLERALMVHKDHVSAVLDVDYSPTGKEFCSGSYDRTVRIFSIFEGKSREVYHTKRMQRIFTTTYSGDARYVLTGSDDTNIRLWKAFSSEPNKVLLPREKSSLNYNSKLKERFKYTPEVGRIDRHRHVPKPVYKAKKLKVLMKDSERRKTQNRIKHSKPGSITIKPEKTKHVILEEE